MSGKTEKIQFKTKDLKDRSLDVVCFGDVGATQKGLVVLQEWWGLNQQIKDAAQMISDNNKFVTMTPDLYRGKLTEEALEAEHFMGGLDWQGAVEDIRGCVLNLLERGCKKVGVTGFCMGGALTFAAAALIPEVSAAAPFYGIPGGELCDVGKIKVPLQCHFGSKDDIKGFSSPEDQDKLQKYLKENNVKFEFFQYEAGHAFTNTTGANYHKASADLALNRLKEFMDKNLK